MRTLQARLGSSFDVHGTEQVGGSSARTVVQDHNMRQTGTWSAQIMRSGLTINVSPSATLAGQGRAWACIDASDLVWAGQSQLEGIGTCAEVEWLQHIQSALWQACGVASHSGCHLACKLCLLGNLLGLNVAGCCLVATGSCKGAARARHFMGRAAQL